MDKEIVVFVVFVNRSAIWEAAFRSFVDERATRKRQREQEALQSSSEQYTSQGRLRKKYTRRKLLAGDSSNNSEGAGGTTASAAVKTLLGDPRYKGSSKKINYDALMVSTYI